MARMFGARCGARARNRCVGLLFFSISLVPTAGVLAIETIAYDGPAEVIAGETFSVLFRLAENEQPLVGYSLNVDVAPTMDAVGSVSGNVGLSNFFEVENFIAQGGGTLHPLFSVIGDPGDGGVAFTALNAQLVPVAAAGPGHDVLAQVFFDVSTDALGIFVLDLGPGSVLTDLSSTEFPFEDGPWFFEVVVPEPASTGSLSLLCAFWVRTRRKP